MGPRLVPTPSVAVKGAFVRTTASVPEEILPNSMSKAVPIVLVRMSVPDSRATPSAIEAAVRSRRTLCASMLRRVVVNISASQVLHVVEDVLGGGAVHLVDDAAVGEEQDPVRVARGRGVVGDHDDGLVEVVDGL